nr:MAG TPA: hypothetical protein [Caudoviricetes sp.]
MPRINLLLCAFRVIYSTTKRVRVSGGHPLQSKKHRPSRETRQTHF